MRPSLPDAKLCYVPSLNEGNGRHERAGVRPEGVLKDTGKQIERTNPVNRRGERRIGLGGRRRCGSVREMDRTCNDVLETAANIRRDQNQHVRMRTTRCGTGSYPSSTLISTLDLTLPPLPAPSTAMWSYMMQRTNYSSKVRSIPSPDINSTTPNGQSRRHIARYQVGRTSSDRRAMADAVELSGPSPRYSESVRRRIKHQARIVGRSSAEASSCTKTPVSTTGLMVNLQDGTHAVRMPNAGKRRCDQMDDRYSPLDKRQMIILDTPTPIHRRISCHKEALLPSSLDTLWPKCSGCSKYCFRVQELVV